MTNITPDSTVADVAVLNPDITRVFETFGIDYCCGGKRTIRQASNNAGIPLDLVMQSLDRSIKDAKPASRDWNTASLREVIAHILDSHHAYIRRESPRIEALLTKVVAKHAPLHPELRQLQAVFGALAQELGVHLLKEEQVLFPMVEMRETGALENSPGVERPVERMLAEHEDAGELLATIRRLTADFTLPPGACVTYQALYQALAAYELDLHQHIHLENNILFPKAVAWERTSNVRP